MLNKEKHQLIMGQVLRDLYTDISISSLLGFKGGSAVYFFHKLPRFSVDLDFDLLSFDKTVQEEVFDKVQKILSKYGKIKDKQVKHATILFWLSYGNSDHNLKVEIRIKNRLPKIRDYYELKKYLGIPILVAKKDYLFAGKLIALTARKQIASRDVYDLDYFAKNRWEINAEVIKAKTGKDVKEYLVDCIKAVEKLKPNQLLQGLGELLGKKDKEWVKKSLKEEVVFLLKNYKAVIK